ncbi:MULTISPECIES: abortive infection family protein [unclassified Akkermansia]|uniref:abortive infection family protein n=1 Tax=unclassified Akkermansia TaxID=2608915 RepID=UPI00244E90D7|nr:MULTISPECIES: abortive infection family protein [unclassified Akkermansia]MDH3069333.1 abortive infection family protein [Akkermansia sp. N21169]MEE0765713.1 abortive infection family protein [Akkermansia sp.]
MTQDWCPGIREACAHWRDAPMLQQTFEALELSLEENNDASIDCAKAIVEVICRVIIDELDSPLNPVKPKGACPDFGEWVASAVRVLKIGESQNTKFLKLVSQHYKLTTALGDLRNAAGPVSHGRDGFLNRLSVHHRRSAVLSADAIVTFLHQAYLEAELDLVRTREPYERFEHLHAHVDSHVSLGCEIDEEGSLIVRVMLPSTDIITLNIEASRLLYQLDREAYVEALNAARGAKPVDVEFEQEKGDE